MASEYLLDDEKFPTMGTSYSLIKDWNSYNKDDSEIICPKNCAIHRPDADNPGNSKKAFYFKFEIKVR